MVPRVLGMAPVQISVSPVCPSITLNDQKNVNNFDFHTLNGHFTSIFSINYYTYTYAHVNYFTFTRYSA